MSIHISLMAKVASHAVMSDILKGVLISKEQPIYTYVKFYFSSEALFYTCYFFIDVCEISIRPEIILL